MMPVVQRNLNEPRAIVVTPHRMRVGTPIIEIAGQKNMFAVRRIANEVDRLGHVLCRITFMWNQVDVSGVVHLQQLVSQFSSIQNPHGFFARVKQPK